MKNAFLLTMVSCIDEVYTYQYYSVNTQVKGPVRRSLHFQCHNPSHGCQYRHSFFHLARTTGSGAIDSVHVQPIFCHNHGCESLIYAIPVRSHPYYASRPAWGAAKALLLITRTGMHKVALSVRVVPWADPSSRGNKLPRTLLKYNCTTQGPRIMLN